MAKFYSWLNEGRNENYFETASCCGIFLNNSQKKRLLEIIKNNEDLEEGVEILNQVIKNNKGDWSLTSFSNSPVSFDNLIKQALGMKEFIDNHVNFSVKGFIHNSIKKYYKKEIDTFNLGKSKPNTSDIVICSDDGKNLLSNFTKDANIDINEKNGTIIINGIKFIQISLKASGESKLGNVKTFLKSKGLDINEGFITNIFSKINSLINNLFNKLKNIIGKYKGKKIDVKKYISESYNPGNLYSKIFKKLEEIEKLGRKNNVPVLVDKSLNKKKELSEKEIFFLIHNDISLKLGIDLINTLKKNPDFLKEMIADGYFGLTELPLWIVYGYGKSPQYLGLKKKYDVGNIKKEKMFIKINPNKRSGSFWFVVDFYILGGLTEDMKKIYYNLGTMPKPSTGAFSVEFRSAKKYIPLHESAYNI